MMSKKNYFLEDNFYSCKEHNKISLYVNCKIKWYER